MDRVGPVPEFKDEQRVDGDGDGTRLAPTGGQEACLVAASMSDHKAKNEAEFSARRFTPTWSSSADAHEALPHMHQRRAAGVTELTNDGGVVEKRLTAGTTGYWNRATPRRP